MRADRLVAELAARQHGIVTLAQLERVGLGARAVRHRAARGVLHRVHRGVYAVGHECLSLDARRLAAVLACGEGAVLSHRWAGAAWGLRPTSRLRIDVTTARRGSRPPTGIELHSIRTWYADEATTLRGIPITTIARTLVDLAAVLPPQALERAVHEAEVLRLLDVPSVEAVLSRSAGRRGTARLRALLATSSPGPTRSALEERFLALCAAGHLPTPTLNTHVGTPSALVEVDALWRRERVIVELDGAATHDTRRAFHADRRRDAALAASGYVVVRLTWDRVTNDVATVVSELHRLLVLRAGWS